jgi:hypothetical protein
MAQQNCVDASTFYPKADMDGDLALLCTAMSWMPGCRCVKAHLKATTEFLRACAAEEQHFSGAVVGDFRRQYLWLLNACSEMQVDVSAERPRGHTEFQASRRACRLADRRIDRCRASKTGFAAACTTALVNAHTRGQWRRKALRWRYSHSPTLIHPLQC